MTLQTRLFIAFLALPLAAQNINTIAGGGPRSLTATAAGVPNPAGVAVDASGNVYVASLITHQILKITAAGVETLFAGNGSSGPFDGDGPAATAVTLGSASGMAFDTAGNLYFCDTLQHRVRKVTPGGAISTIAGNGTAAFSGDTGLAVNASLNSPTGIAVDSGNNVFISDTGNQRVRMVISATGVISTIAGTGVAGYTTDYPTAVAGTSAMLNRPFGLAVDTAGSVYVADSANLRIRKISSPLSSPTITTFAGDGTNNFSANPTPANSSGLNSLVNVAVDSSNNVYIVEAFDVRRVVAGSGSITLVAGTGNLGFSGDGTFSPTTATFRNLTGIGIDATASNIYLADAANSRIRKIVTSSNAVSTFAGNGSLNYNGDGGPATNANLFNPSSPALDAAGNLLFADGGSFAVRKVTLSSGVLSTVAGNGIGSLSADGQPAGSSLNGAYAVALDGSGNVYFAETGHIRKVSGGVLSTVAASTSFSNPAGLAIASNGNIYIADSAANKVYLFTASTSAVTVVAGTGTASFGGDGGSAVNATLNGPAPLALDSVNNKLYIGDTRNNRVRVVDLTAGTINTVAGNGTTTFSDGGAATATGLSSPIDLHLDGAGNLYIADEQHFRVRKVSGGTITTVAGNGTQDYSGDGGAALSAAVQPHGITLDSAGTLYIADASGRIRSVAGIGSNQLTAVSVSPSAGSGISQTFTAVLSDPSGASLFTRRLFLINSVLSGSSACFVQVDQFGIYLVNDAGSGLTGPLSGSGTLTNSQCTLSGSGSSVLNSGTTSTITLPIAFKGAFTGLKNIYLYGEDSNGVTTGGFQARGTFNILSVPTADSVTPNAGSGTTQAFTAFYSDSSSAILNRRLFLINSSLNGSGACFVQVDPTGTYLATDDDSALLGPLFGSGTLSNSQCTLNGAGTSVSNSSTTSTVNLSITFKPSFAGAKNIYMYADDSQSNSGFQLRGSFNVLSGAAAPTADSVTPNSASGLNQVFTAVYSDPSGAGALTRRLFLVNNVLNGSNACFVQVDQSGIYLLSDSLALTGPLSGAATLSNSQCTLNGTGTSSVNSGNSSTVTLSISFKPAFAGAKNIYMYDEDAGGNSGFQLRGIYSVSTSVPTADSVTPNAGSGTSQVFTAVYSDAAGAGSLTRRLFLVNGSLQGAGGCLVQVDNSGTYLANDADSALTGPLSPGGTLTNSQCTLNGSGTGVSNFGNSSTVTLSITFKEAFGGARNIFLYAEDSSNSNSGFQNRGTFTVLSGTSAPSPASVSPSTGSGSSQTFTAVYTNPAGAAQFNRRLFLINSVLTGSGGCFVQVDNTGTYLVNDAGNGLSAALTGSNSLSNSQCTLNGAGSSVGNSATDTTAVLSITFKPAFAGAKTIYMYAEDNSNHNSGFVNKGSFTAQ